MQVNNLALDFLSEYMERQQAQYEAKQKARLRKFRDND